MGLLNAQEANQGASPKKPAHNIEAIRVAVLNGLRNIADLSTGAAMDCATGGSRITTAPGSLALSKCF